MGSANPPPREIAASAGLACTFEPGINYPSTEDTSKSMDVVLINTRVRPNRYDAGMLHPSHSLLPEYGGCKNF